MRIGRGNGSPRRKPAPVPLRPPEIWHDLTRTRTQAATLGSRRLTTWAMARRLGWEDNIKIVRFEVHTTVILKIHIFWDVTPCSPLEVHSRFGETKTDFCHESPWVSKRRKIVLESVNSNLLLCCFPLRLWRVKEPFIPAVDCFLQ
jgi:hypothetical protein